jgi:hypothetical protein
MGGSRLGPSSRSWATIAAREVTPSLEKLRRRCDETVHELMPSTEAIVLLAYPLATMRAISNSRGLSADPL